jgi:hypothetical protein
MHLQRPCAETVSLSTNPDPTWASVCKRSAPLVADSAKRRGGGVIAYSLTNSGPRPGWRLRVQSSPESPKADFRPELRDGTDAGTSAGTGAPLSLPLGQSQGQQGRAPPLSPIATTTTLAGSGSSVSASTSTSASMPLNGRRDGEDAAHDGPAPQLSQPPGARRSRAPLMGLPTSLVDQLLAVYFTHVHVRPPTSSRVISSELQSALLS